MSRGMSQASYGLSVAFGFVAVVIGFWLAGRWLDAALGIEPWAQVVGAVVGWVCGVVVVVVVSARSRAW
jgi:hypothetical protein